jgi:hypothetical protein
VQRLFVKPSFAEHHERVFRSITESIDTTTPAGHMMMQMVGSFAEFERAMIRERTSAGVDCNALLSVLLRSLPALVR